MTPPYTEWPSKTERHTYHNMWIHIIGISVWGHFSRGKKDTKTTNFGYVVCFLEHILWDNFKTKMFPFQLKLDENECHFGLLELWAVIHLILSMRIDKIN